MTFFTAIISFAAEFLTFYIPTFYTFKFLMNNNVPKIRTVLKFWCILSLYYLIQLLLSNIIAGHIFPLIDLIVLVGLNFHQFQYAQMIYDSAVTPLYANNRQTIQNLSTQIQKIFNKNSEKLKQKVTQTTSQKVKGFIGQILVGTLNPRIKRQDSQYSSTDGEDKQE